MSRRFLLLDANIVAGYYLPRSLHSKQASDRIKEIFDSVRSGKSDFLLYVPNFCIAEVFSVFMKHTYGSWNHHVRKKRTIDTRVYDSLVKQFQADIHNCKFLTQYELSRYHILGINHVAPIDHYFQLSRRRGPRSQKRRIAPAGTFDHLIISMGIYLTHLHGEENVIVISTDDRMLNILTKCKAGLPPHTVKKLKLNRNITLTGKAFSPEIFPRFLNLKNCSVNNLANHLGEWPLQIGKVPANYRWTKN